MPSIPSTNFITGAISGGGSKTAIHKIPASAISLDVVEQSTGENITITGTGFPAYATVGTMTIGGIDVGPTPSPATDSDGDFSSNVMVPGLVSGTHNVSVTVSSVTGNTLLDVVANTVYMSSLGGYTVVAPASLVVLELSPAAVAFTKELANGSLAYVVIEVESVEAGLSTAQYADAKIALGANQDFDFYNLDSLNLVTIGGQLAWKATETFKRPNDTNTRKGDEYFFVFDNLGYGIFSESNVSDWNSMQPTFNQVLESLVWN
jgi:hypothetical protein